MVMYVIISNRKQDKMWNKNYTYKYKKEQIKYEFLEV